MNVEIRSFYALQLILTHSMNHFIIIVVRIMYFDYKQRGLSVYLREFVFQLQYVTIRSLFAVLE